MTYKGDTLFKGYDPGMDDKYRKIYGPKADNHLTADDFKCPCCGISLVDKSFLARINKFIDKYGKKIKISSGYRCPKYNAEIGGAKTSPHVKGIAVDIKEQSARAKRKMNRIANELKFMGFGVYDKHIHLDDDPRWHNSEVLWSGTSK